MPPFDLNKLSVLPQEEIQDAIILYHLIQINEVHIVVSLQSTSAFPFTEADGLSLQLDTNEALEIFRTTPDNMIKEIQRIQTRLPLLKIYFTTDGNFIRVLSTCTQSLLARHRTLKQGTPEGRGIRVGQEIINALKGLRDEMAIPEHPEKKNKVEKEA
jgi:hypothetical protein